MAAPSLFWRSESIGDDARSEYDATSHGKCTIVARKTHKNANNANQKHEAANGLYQLCANGHLVSVGEMVIG